MFYKLFTDGRCPNTQVDDPQRYNDEVIYPDKVRLNLYYLQHYSFWMDLKMIFATVLGRKIEFAGEEI